MPIAHNKRVFKKKIDLSDGGLRFRLEYEKTKAVNKIFKSDSFIKVPDMLECDSKNGIIIFEYIENLRPIWAGTNIRWFERIGECLGVIHQRLVLDEKLTIKRKKDLGREGLVFVHGDYWRGNMGISNGKLIIFDWATKPWDHDFYSLATPSVDLASFFAEWLIPQRYHLMLPLGKMKRFLKSYKSTVGYNSAIGTLAVETLQESMEEYYLKKVNRTYKHKGLIGSIMRAKMIWNIWRFENEIFR